MQDSRNNDQQYMDKGWQLMSALLDKEMPQGRGNRRIAWWLVAAGVVLILSGWGYFTLRDAKVHSAPEVPMSQSEKPGVATTQIVPADGDNTTRGTQSENETGTSLVADTPLQKDVISEQSVQNVKTNIASSTQTDAFQKMPDAIKTVSDNYQAVEQLPNAHYTGSGNSRTFEQMPNAPNTVSGNSRDMEQMPNAIGPGINLSEEIVHAPTAPDDEAVNPKMSQKPREEILVSIVQMPLAKEFERGLRTLPIEVAHATKIRGFGLEGFFSTHLNSDGNPFYGVEVGLSAVWRTHKRLRFHTGLSYGYYNVDGLGVFGLSKNMSDEALNAGTGNPLYTGPEFDVEDVYSNSLDFTEAIILTEKFHYLHMPLHAEYLITPRLSAMAGVKVSALIGAPARYRLNDARFIASQPFVSSSSRSFLYNYDILRKFDIAPMIGVSYALGGHWSLSASYTRGMVHYINSSETAERNDLHRSASVGVRYRIL